MVRTDGDGGISKTVAVAVSPKVSLTVPKRLSLGKATVLRGTVAPGRGSVQLVIERRTSSGKYVKSATVAAKRSGRRVTVSVTPKVATLYRFRLLVGATSVSAAGQSELAYGRALVRQAGGGASVG